ncbi:hypothetical protein XELAEV_18039772mg [Xenopus laevis]|uniref:Uncharacterized protein n=1 Tax=Xenopus laevis TaxID=8355 RepID=A0A974C8C9_XENLA|nr:hypothetical protein XELAEV_18039772mg [Xenopus laevis]
MPHLNAGTYYPHWVQHTVRCNSLHSILGADRDVGNRRKCRKPGCFLLHYLYFTYKQVLNLVFTTTPQAMQLGYPYKSSLRSARMTHNHL